MIGKTNTPEFGTGSQTVNEVFGPTHNPYDPSRTAGDSSGGAAAALATRMVPLADGTDMRGSLRNPAGFCNVVGLRPTAGLVPTWPARDGWFTLAVDGPMARTVADLALLLSVLAGYDPRSPVAWPGDGSRFADPLDADVRGARVAWWPRPEGLPVDPTVVQVLERDGREALLTAGLYLVEGGPDLSGADDAFRVLRAWHYAAAFGPDYRERRAQLADSMAWNIEQGLHLRGQDVAHAFELRTELYLRVQAFMRSVDVLAMPVSQVPPFPVDQPWVTEIDGKPMGSYLDWMASCYLISATGLPALSLPCGYTHQGLPVGVQLVGRPGGDLELLRIAGAVEATAEAWRREPVLC